MARCLLSGEWDSRGGHWVWVVRSNPGVRSNPYLALIIETHHFKQIMRPSLKDIFFNISELIKV